MLFPRGRRAILSNREVGHEWETLKLISAIQSSNLEKPNFYFMKFRMISKIAPGQHGNYPDTSIWEHTITSFGGQTSVLQFGLCPADLRRTSCHSSWNWQDLDDLTWCFVWKSITSRLREDRPCLRIKFQNRHLTLIVSSTSLYAHLLSGILSLLLSSHALSLPSTTMLKSPISKIKSKQR